MEQIIEQVQQLILTALGLLAAAVAAYVTAYMRGLLDKLQGEHLRRAVWDAVASAEQLFADDNKRGDQKLEYAERLLRSAGYSPTDTRVRAMIEAAVYELGMGCHDDPQS